MRFIHFACRGFIEVLDLFVAAGFSVRVLYLIRGDIAMQLGVTSGSEFALMRGATAWAFALCFAPHSCELDDTVLSLPIAFNCDDICLTAAAAFQRKKQFHWGGAPSR